MQGKTVLITGATSGIGKITARALAQQGARVIFTARSEAKAQSTLSYLKDYADPNQISYFLCDFASQQQIHKLANNIKKNYGQLDVLINNAGAVFSNYKETEDGIERTFAVNHIAYFLLTHLLLESLKSSAPARIVNVASDAHKAVKHINFDDLGFRQNYAVMKAYSLSKIANIMFSYELARRLKGTNVTVNALHPGFVATNIGANMIPIVGKAIKWLINLSAKDVETGAKTSIYLASSKDVEGITGKYFANEKELRSNELSYNEELQKQLWDVSMQMINKNNLSS